MATIFSSGPSCPEMECCTWSFVLASCPTKMTLRAGRACWLPPLTSATLEFELSRWDIGEMVSRGKIQIWNSLKTPKYTCMNSFPWIFSQPFRHVSRTPTAPLCQTGTNDWGFHHRIGNILVLYACYCFWVAYQQHEWFCFAQKWMNEHGVHYLCFSWLQKDKRLRQTFILQVNTFHVIWQIKFKHFNLTDDTIPTNPTTTSISCTDKGTYTKFQQHNWA